jgi:hypothetical protein
MAEPKQDSGASSQSSELLQGAQSLASKVAETAQEKALGLAATAEEKARQFAEEKKRQAAEQVDDVARAVEGVAAPLERAIPLVGTYVRSGASEIRRLSSTLRERSIDDLMDEAREFARRRPGAVLIGAIVTGVALARFMKASADRRSDKRMRREAAPRRAATSDPRTDRSSQVSSPTDPVATGQRSTSSESSP